MFQKGQFLGLFCKVIGNIRNYLRLFNNYTALAYVLLMELAFEDFEHGLDQLWSVVFAI
jgi:hypothetical protein